MQTTRSMAEKLEAAEMEIGRLNRALEEWKR